MNNVLALQFAKFTGVGAVATVTHYAVLIILVETAGVWPTMASASGFAVGALINYLLNRWLTFRSSVSHLMGLAKFFTVASIGAVLNTILFDWAVSTFAVHYLVAQMFATLLVLVWNFLGNRYWTFKDAR